MGKTLGKILGFICGGLLVFVLIALLLGAFAGLLALVVDALLSWGFPQWYTFTFVQTYVVCMIVVIVSGFFSSGRRK